MFGVVASHLYNWRPTWRPEWYTCVCDMDRKKRWCSRKRWASWNINKAEFVGDECKGWAWYMMGEWVRWARCECTGRRLCLPPSSCSQLIVRPYGICWMTEPTWHDQTAERWRWGKMSLGNKSWIEEHGRESTSKVWCQLDKHMRVTTRRK